MNELRHFNARELAKLRRRYPDLDFSPDPNETGASGENIISRNRSRQSETRWALQGHTARLDYAHEAERSKSLKLGSKEE